MSRTTTMKKEKATKPCITPLDSNETAKAKFIQSIGDGNQSDVERFLRLVESIVAENRSFTLSQLIKASIPYDLSAGIVTTLFDRWLTVMEKNGRIDVIQEAQSCYSENLFIVN